MRLLPVVMPERAEALILALGWALVLFLVQGLLIGLVVAALLRVLRNRSADLRYGVACTGLLAMAICPVWTTAQELAAGHGELTRGPSAVVAPARAADLVVRHNQAMPTARPIGTPVAESGSDQRDLDAIAITAAPVRITTARPGWRQRIEAWLPFVVAAWLAGVCVLALRLLKGLAEVHGLTRHGLLGPTDELWARITRLVDRAGLRRPVGWFLSVRVEVPTVVGWLWPRVLIPASSLARLTLGQLEAVLAHEIAHIRRHDYLVNMLQIGVEALLFFHPAVWWVSRQIRDEREHCCDDMAVALCGGDRLLLARALFTLEEHRVTSSLQVAASGGSLRDRVRRLVVPRSAETCPAASGWAGAGLIAVAVGLVALAGLARPIRARDDARPAGKTSVRGRVLDEAGGPVAGARVRLYRREGPFERRNSMIEQTHAGADGSFVLQTPLQPLPLSQSRGQSPYVLLADHPGQAVGWRTIPKQATTFEGDIVLTAPIERTITVLDGDDRPVPGAKVVAYSLGDASSPSPLLQDVLGLRPDDGPTTTMTDATGRATFRQLPRTNASFVATKPDFAETYAFREQNTIRLTPSATLSGTLTGPDGRPLPGVKIVLFTDFMWDFERGVTDDKGRFAFADLKARGWDMSAWGPHTKPGNGTYKVWIESERFAIPTHVVTLDPGERETLDLQAQPAGVIRVSVTEAETDKPVANVRIWGFDRTTGGSARFNAYTDEKGRATFYSTPAWISLSIAGPPDGCYIQGASGCGPDSVKNFEFEGGEVKIALKMAPITGPVITVSGICTRPDGTPVAGVGVSPAAGRFVTSGASSFIRTRRADAAGQFTLDGVPAGQMLMIYAETDDRKLAGTTQVQAPAKADPGFRLKVPVESTVVAEFVAKDKQGQPLRSRKFHISPRVADQDFPFVRRTAESDDQGRIKLDGIVRGLAYRVQEDVPPISGPIAVAGGRPPWYEEVLVLAPVEGK
jgi:beta-lactamase regulating signal transducer with metallopeptidase domain